MIILEKSNVASEGWCNACTRDNDLAKLKATAYDAETQRRIIYKLTIVRSEYTNCANVTLLCPACLKQLADQIEQLKQ